MTDRLPDDEVPVSEPSPTDPAQDAWGEAVAEFLADLLDNVEVVVHSDCDTDPGARREDRFPEIAQRGADDRARQFSLRTRTNADSVYAASDQFPDELDDLPGAALRALTRLTRSASASDLVYPSVTRALHEVIIAEVIADRLARRPSGSFALDDMVGMVADTLDYFTELAATSLEARPVTHGVVIAADRRGLEPISPPVRYPGQLPTRKRTPLLFDGTQSALIVATSGEVLRSIGRDSLPAVSDDAPGIAAFDDFSGLDGSLTAAASASFRGIGIYLRADRSIWIFDHGRPLFIRRTTKWKSIAFNSFTRAVTTLGATGRSIGERVARAALRLSMQGQGAVLAVVPDSSDLDGIVQPTSRAQLHHPGLPGSVDDDLRRLLTPEDLASSGGLARLARLDGATIIDTTGHVVAYGAIVQHADSRGEGARTTAARALSEVANVTLSVSQDGPITVFHEGEAALELL